MKSAVAAATLSLFMLAANPAFAQSGHPGHDHQAAPAGQKSAAPSEGTVQKVDRAGGKLTITHGPLENLGMPAMTMVFRVSDAAMLDGIKTGDKIRFVASRVQGTFTVTELETIR